MTEVNHHLRVPREDLLMLMLEVAMLVSPVTLWQVIGQVCQVKGGGSTDKQRSSFFFQCDRATF